MLAQVARALERQQWIAFLGWEPHAMNTRFRLVYLSGGDRYFGANYGSATVHTVTRKNFAAECPNLNRFYSQLTFNVGLENAVIARMLDQQQTAQEAAREELKRRPELLDSWLDGVTTRGGEPAKPAVIRYLGL